MKKYIAMAVAAGALAVGGAASAQTLGQIFGFGNPYPTYNHNRGIPAVVAGTQPYGSTVYIDQYGRQVQSTTYGQQVYIDQYGRQVHLDQYGRQVLVQPSTSTYGITGYDAWGRPIYGTTTYGTTTYGTPYGTIASLGDRDGDGFRNERDRYPDDPRYR